MEDQIFDSQARSEIPVENITPPPSSWREFFRNKKVIFGIGAALLAIVFIFWFFFSHTNIGPSPKSSHVVLLIKGPEQLASENETEYTVVYRNGENADMVNISLEMFYPTGFKFKSAEPPSSGTNGQNFNLPLVKEGESGQVIIRGKLSGGTGEDKEIKAKLHYSLSNFNSEFVVEQNIHTAILPPNLTIDITGPAEAVNGQDATYVVNYTNVSTLDYSDLALQLTYPSGFSFTSATPPALTNNNYWKLPALASGHTGSVTISGSFSGQPGEDKMVRAELGKIINNTFAPQVVSTTNFRIIAASLNLTVEASPSSYLKLGDLINYKLHYSNDGRVGLNNLVITVNLDGPALDLSRIAAPNAIITGKTVTWKAATLSNLSLLSPNEQGDITFTVPLKTSLTTNLKNQTVTATAAIASKEISQPTKAAPLQQKIISALDLSVDGQYVSGAAPMEVGKPTVFALTFTLTNLSNDLSDVVAVASVPLPASAWKNIVVQNPPGSKAIISYDSNSGKITWRIGDLPAFTGKFSPAQQVTFQLEVIPNEADRSKTVTLLSNIQASGMDTFVGEQIQTPNINTVNTGTLDDDVMNTKGATVQ